MVSKRPGATLTHNNSIVCLEVKLEASTLDGWGRKKKGQLRSGAMHDSCIK